MPTKAECASALRWCRDKFASWLATTWLYLILWTVVAITFGVLLYIDGKFSRSLAEGVEAIDPLSFQMMGWAYRLFAAAFLMAAARCAYKGIKGKWAFRALGVFASIIVCLHAFGFGFEALSDRRDQAMAVREIAETKANGSADLIAALETRKTTIDTDTTAAVVRLDAEITQYITDGKNNDHLADDARERRNALQDTATADKKAIDDEIMGLIREASTGKAEAVAVSAETKAWAPLFIGIAQLVTWSKEPSDWAIYLCAIGFVIFWVLLGESLVIFLPERIYVMHLKDAEGRPGVHEIRMTDEELAEYQRAMEKHENTIAGGKKAAQTKAEKKEAEERTLRQQGKIEMSMKEARKKVSGFLVMRAKGHSIADIAEANGMSPAALEISYRAYIDDEQYELLFGRPRWAGVPESAPKAAEPEPAPEPEAADEAPADPVEDEPAPEPEEASTESDLFEIESPENVIEENENVPDENEIEPEVTEPEPSPERGLELWKPQPKADQGAEDELV